MKQLLIPFATILTTLLACNLPSAAVGPVPPTDAPQPSTDALNSFNNKWRDLSLNATEGTFSLVFSEAELTSALDEALTQAAQQQGEPLPVHDPQVVLRNNQIEIYGQLELEAVNANGLIVATPQIGPDGLVDITITSVEFGPIELDPGMLTAMEQSAENLINAPLVSSPMQ